MVSCKEEHTPFPECDGSNLSSLWERAQKLSYAILTEWEDGYGWCALGAGLWQRYQAFINEATANKKKREKEERKERKEKQSQWAEEAVQKGAGIAHKTAKEKPEVMNPESPDITGRLTGCHYEYLLAEVGAWDKVWTAEATEEEHAEAMKIINEVIKLEGHHLPKITWQDVAEAAKLFKARAATPEGSLSY